MIDFKTLSMVRNVHSGMWHIVEWVDRSTDEEEGGRWVDLSICNNQRVRTACYPNEDLPHRFYRGEVDESLFNNTCKRCQQKYETRMVKRFREELKELD